MRLRVLVIPDKFKGTLTAREAAAAIASGWRQARPEDQVTLLPMSDGGDGFGEVLGAATGARPRRTETVDAAHRRCRATWWWDATKRTAMIESARVIGLAMLPRGRFHPFELDTFGLGKVLRAAAEKGARRCVVGIGGSATNDGGFGLARALGWRFLDGRGGEIDKWTALDGLRQVRPPARKRLIGELVTAVDVRNPLLGARGCTRVYGPQKGLRQRDLAHAEKCLRRLATVMREQAGVDYASEPGAGAAGGLGFGLRAFAGARLEPGFEVFAAGTGLERLLGLADLVITGEGAIDRQTLMGKGVGELAGLCRERGVLCIALAGRSLVRGRGARFATVAALTDVTSVAEAMSNPARWLRVLAEKTARDWDGIARGRGRG
jgi:glycerate kinase